jgi:hypothetical protein
VKIVANLTFENIHDYTTVHYDDLW